MLQIQSALSFQLGERKEALLAREWPSSYLSGCVGVLHGPQKVLRFYPWLVAPILLAEEPIIIADGGNSFDPYGFGEIAQLVSQEPKDILNRIHVSRAFTCHQMLALVRRLAGFARRRQARVIVLSSLVDTYYDEAIPAQEARYVWEATRAYLCRLVRKNFLILVICPEHPMEAKHVFRASLIRTAKWVATYHEGKGGAQSLHLVKPWKKNYILECTANKILGPV